MHYQVCASPTDPRPHQLCKWFPDRPLRCAGVCGAVLPPTHIHLWFADAEFATGVCSEACAGAAIRRRRQRRRLTEPALVEPA